MVRDTIATAPQAERRLVHIAYGGRLRAVPSDVLFANGSTTWLVEAQRNPVDP